VCSSDLNWGHNGKRVAALPGGVGAVRCWDGSRGACVMGGAALFEARPRNKLG
jgi:hypothetical protein